MAERIFRLASLIFLGIGLAVGLTSVDHRPSAPLVSSLPQNPSLEIEAAQEIQRINGGTEPTPIETHVKGRRTKEMAASFSQQ